MSPADAASYSPRELTHWGLLDAVRREAARDQLMAAVAMPPPAVAEVLLQQWAQQQSLGSQAALEQWLQQRGLAPDDLAILVARPWRWQQWCERHGAAQLNTHFLARKASLDQVSFWRLQTGDAELASELYQRLREGETNFEQLAQQAQHAQSNWQVSFSGLIPLGQLPQDLAALLRVSEVGALWPPRPAHSAATMQILQLDQRQPAVLDDALRQRLLIELGEEALAQQMGARL